MGLNYWKNGLASSVVTIKKDQRSRLSSFENIKPKLIEQVKLGFNHAAKTQPQNSKPINQRKVNNLFKAQAKKVVPNMNEGSTIANEIYYKSTSG